MTKFISPVSSASNCALFTLLSIYVTKNFIWNDIYFLQTF